jgi:hypothetical protein
MKSSPAGVPVPPSGVATPTPARLHSSAACGHCGREIPRPRTGQKACGPRCRWALWKAGQQTGAQELRAGLLVLQAQVEALLALAAKLPMERRGGRK